MQKLKFMETIFNDHSGQECDLITLLENETPDGTQNQIISRLKELGMESSEHSIKRYLSGHGALPEEAFWAVSRMVGGDSISFALDCFFQLQVGRRPNKIGPMLQLWDPAYLYKAFPVDVIEDLYNQMCGSQTDQNTSVVTDNIGEQSRREKTGKIFSERVNKVRDEKVIHIQTVRAKAPMYFGFLTELGDLIKITSKLSNGEHVIKGTATMEDGEDKEIFLTSEADVINHVAADNEIYGLICQDGYETTTTKTYYRFYSSRPRGKRKSGLNNQCVKFVRLDPKGNEIADLTARLELHRKTLTQG